MVDATENNEYKPTDAENKLLEVMLNPENRFLSKTATCEKAGINRTTYYRIFSKPEFVAYYKKKALDLVDQAVVPIINTFNKLAIAGSFQHGKAVLDMARMSNDTLKIKTANVNLNAEDTKEAAKIYAELIRSDD